METVTIPLKKYEDMKRELNDLRKQVESKEVHQHSWWEENSFNVFLAFWFILLIVITQL